MQAGLDLQKLAMLAQVMPSEDSALTLPGTDWVTQCRVVVFLSLRACHLDTEAKRLCRIREKPVGHTWPSTSALALMMVFCCFCIICLLSELCL